MQFYFEVIALLFFFAIDEVNAKCSGGNCEKFACVSDYYVHRSTDSHLRSFNSICSCSSDWSSSFCEETLNSVKNNSPNLPTVCVCRKFSDNGSKCQQFITRCFQRRDNECSCCFNQPSEWCNQLKCKNREPDFQNANTSCVCHHTQYDYPYEICPNRLPQESRREILDRSVHNSGMSNPEYIELLGNKVPTTTITYLIVGLLLTIALLTLLMLVIGGNKLKRQRSERQRQTRLARETLIMQRADDDRYLPSA